MLENAFSKRWMGKSGQGVWALAASLFAWDLSPSIKTRSGFASPPLSQTSIPTSRATLCSSGGEIAPCPSVRPACAYAALAKATVAPQLMALARTITEFWRRAGEQRAALAVAGVA